jgi:3-oxoacyl-[acyl-carrier protein] reductase
MNDHAGMPIKAPGQAGMALSFRASRAMVTGAGRGIGQALAVTLAAQGLDVCAADVDEQGLRQTRELIEQGGGRCRTLALDVGDPAAVDTLTALQQPGQFGVIDYLVNNAGVSPKRDGVKRMVWEIDPQEWQRVMAVNLNGCFHTLRAVLPGMIKNGFGAVVNIGSLAGHRYSGIAAAHYCASKAAIEGLTRQAAGETAAHGVRINCVAPGRIETPMALAAAGDMNARIVAETPLRRIGQPADIAAAVCFLLSEASSFTTGQTLYVSGGRGL